MLLDKCLGLVSLMHFVSDFSRVLSVLYSINWPNFIVWLPVFCEILSNIIIVIICFQDYDLINLDIDLNFLITSFSCIIKSQDKNLNIFKTKRVFKAKKKKHFSPFLRVFSCQRLSLIWEWTFNYKVTKSENKSVDSK